MIEVLLNAARTLTIVRRLETKLDAALAALARLETKMSTQTDAWAALAAVETKLEADFALDEQTVKDLTAERDSLKSQLATLPQDDTARLAALTTKLQDLDARIVAAQVAAEGAPPAGTGTTGSDTSSGTSAGGTAPSPGADSATAQAEAQAPADTTGGSTAGQ